MWLGRAGNAFRAACPRMNALHVDECDQVGSMDPELKLAFRAPLRLDFWTAHSLSDLLREARVVVTAGLRPWLLARRAYHYAGYAGTARWYREISYLLGMLAEAPPRFALEIGVGHGGSMFAWMRV